MALSLTCGSTFIKLKLTVIRVLKNATSEVLPLLEHWLLCIEHYVEESEYVYLLFISFHGIRTEHFYGFKFSDET